MLLLLLGPLVILVMLVATQLRTQRTTASDSMVLADRIELMAEVGALNAPAAFEQIASLGLVQIDALDIGRAVVVGYVGYDMTVYLDTARTAVDAALNRLAERHPDVRLPDGSIVGERIAEVRRDLDQQRSLLDATNADATYLAAATNRMLALVDDLTSYVINDANTTGSTIDSAQLASLAASPLHLVELVNALSGEARASASVLTSPDGTTTGEDVYRAMGAADAELARYDAYVTGSDRDAWTALQRDPSIVAYDALGPQIDVAVAERAASPSALTDPTMIARKPEFVQFLASVQQASFARLAAYDGYVQAVLADDADEARTVGDDADRAATIWLVALIVVAAASIIALTVTLRATVRPLADLAERARHIGSGELGDAPLPLIGPTDVREVTATVNAMAATIDIFDDQLGLVIAGRPSDPTAIASLPGAFGTSLRASIDQLSDVTSRLRESEALVARRSSRPPPTRSGRSTPEAGS
jgi:methyl-accepting chemotaxis protein